ncbi:MAG: hypothetical protein HUK22_01590 [Thermoguttaceae bacterium]|nr:hypothetical protein [Thermoguttaceae bacterium]
MRIGQVIGKVVLNRAHASLTGAQFKIVLPLTLDDLIEPSPIEAADAAAKAERAAGLTPSQSAAAAENRLLNPGIPRKWGNELVVYDDCCAALDEWVAFSEGAEAAAAFGPKQRPIDAFAGAIIDTLTVDSAVAASLLEKK